MFVKIDLRDGSTIDVNSTQIVSVEKKECDVYTSVYLSDGRVLEVMESPDELLYGMDRDLVIAKRKQFYVRDKFKP